MKPVRSLGTAQSYPGANRASSPMEENCGKFRDWERSRQRLKNLSSASRHRESLDYSFVSRHCRSPTGRANKLPKCHYTLY